MTRTGSAACNVLLFVVFFAVSLGCIELAFRWLDLRGYHQPRDASGQLLMHRPAEALLPGVHVQYRGHGWFRHVYESNPRHYFDADNALTYELNGLGFRGPDPVFRKRPGDQRIVVLGDSFTFGEGVRREHTFAYLLEGLLTGEGDGRVEALNFSVGGWGTSDEINYLEQQGLYFRPDLVVVVFVLNDADYAGGIDLWRKFVRTYESRELRDSYLASYAYAAWARRTLAREHVEGLVDAAFREPDRWRAALGDLRRGRDAARAAGSEFAVVLFPFLYALDETHPFQPLHQLVGSFCQAEGIPFLDLFEAFEGRDYEELWVHPSDQHPNEHAHAIAASEIADFVEREGLLRVVVADRHR